VAGAVGPSTSASVTCRTPHRTPHSSMSSHSAGRYMHSAVPTHRSRDRRVCAASGRGGINSDISPIDASPTPRAGDTGRPSRWRTRSPGRPRWWSRSHAAPPNYVNRDHALSPPPPRPPQGTRRALATCPEAFPPSIFRDKNRCDIGKSQPKWIPKVGKRLAHGCLREAGLVRSAVASSAMSPSWVRAGSVKLADTGRWSETQSAGSCMCAR
jgi:hypothetical protein